MVHTPRPFLGSSPLEPSCMGAAPDSARERTWPWQHAVQLCELCELCELCWSCVLTTLCRLAVTELEIPKRLAAMTCMGSCSDTPGPPLQHSNSPTA